MNKLRDKQCIPCQGGIPPLSDDEIQPYLEELDSWQAIEDNSKIQKEFVFADFQAALNFINRVGAIAEAQEHHPNIFLHDYKKVTITLYTHKIGGLHENDFILADKIDAVVHEE